jgi:hypothetical protein
VGLVWQAKLIVVVGEEELETKLLVAVPVAQLAERGGLMVEELVRLDLLSMVMALPGVLLVAAEVEDSSQGPAVPTRAARERTALSRLLMRPVFHLQWPSMPRRPVGVLR